MFHRRRKNNPYPRHLLETEDPSPVTSTSIYRLTSPPCEEPSPRFSPSSVSWSFALSRLFYLSGRPRPLLLVPCLPSIEPKAEAKLSFPARKSPKGDEDFAMGPFPTPQSAPERLNITRIPTSDTIVIQQAGAIRPAATEGFTRPTHNTFVVKN